MSYFKNTDLDMNYSHWQSNSKIKFFLLPPLAFDTKLQGVQSKSNSQQTRIDFILKKNKNEIIWQDLINGKTFKFELVKDSIDKIIFTGESGVNEIWNRISIEKASIWL